MRRLTALGPFNGTVCRALQRDGPFNGTLQRDGPFNGTLTGRDERRNLNHSAREIESLDRVYRRFREPPGRALLSRSWNQSLRSPETISFRTPANSRSEAAGMFKLSAWKFACDCGEQNCSYDAAVVIEATAFVCKRAESF